MMVQLWTSFARTGQPAADGVPAWPAWGESRQLLRIAAAPTVETEQDSERFDLHESIFARVESCEAARALEAQIKSDLAAYRSECPSWVPIEAGGHTEWFDAAHLAHATAKLHAVDEGASLVIASDFVRMELAQQTASFELWAVHQANFIAQALSSSVDAHMAFGVARALRDWLDAYRSCDIELFTDDPAVLAFVKDAIRHAG